MKDGDVLLWIQRRSGHLVLAALALLLFVVGHSLSAEVDEGGVIAVVPPAAEPAREEPAGLPTPTPVDPSTLPVQSDASLAPILNPHTFRGRQPEHRYETYVVQAGDTPNIIADRFGIRASTLLGGNPWLSEESNRLQSGTELRILPIDGLMYEVRDGDSLESIAEKFKVNAQDIIDYGPNNLEFPYRLHVGTELLIPGAVQEVFVWSPPETSGRGAAGRQWQVVGTGSFQWPVGGRCITQYYWYGHPAIDVALPIGTPVYAADTGTVTYASWASGIYFDYGNLIVINHGNNFETFYAHLNDIAVHPGQIVYKGNYIGASGNTGRSSGPHLHFEIRAGGVQLDPLGFLSGGTQDCR